MRNVDRQNRALYRAVRKIINNGMYPDYLEYQYIVLHHNDPVMRPAINPPDYSEGDQRKMRNRLHAYLDIFMDATFKTPENDTRLFVFPVDSDYLQNQIQFMDITDIN